MRKNMTAAILAAGLVLAGQVSFPEPVQAGASALATDAQTEDQTQAANPEDGRYFATFKTDSGMFHVNEAYENQGLLTVKDEAMTIHVTLASDHIINLYPGTAEQAREDEGHWLDHTTDQVTYDDGYQEVAYGFDVPVEKLDQAFDLALLGAKGKWYDHKVTVSNPQRADAGRADAYEDSISYPERQTEAGPEAYHQTEADGSGEAEADLALADGQYTFEAKLEGGSGRTTLDGPVLVTAEDGAYSLHFTLSSKKYDYLVYDGETYKPVNQSGNSTFEIPVTSLADPIGIDADTTAMGDPHLISYQIVLDQATCREAGQTEEDLAETEAGKDKQKEVEESAGQKAGRTETTNAAPGKATAKTTGQKGRKTDEAAELTPPLSVLGDHAFLSSDKEDAAVCFRIDRYADRYTVLVVSDGRSYCLVPEGGEVPADLPEEMTVFRLPLSHLYLAASAAMCNFDAIGATEVLQYSALKEDRWSIPAAREAMERGDLVYAGKYSAPDYEQLVAGAADGAIESTMILHTPKVEEKLEKLGIPVLIDRSSFEPNPLGRAEWVKVYGALTGREKEAREAYESQKEAAAAVSVRVSAAREASDGTDYAEDDPEGGGSAENVSGKTVAFFSVNSAGQIVTRRPDDFYAKMIEAAGGLFLAPHLDSAQGQDSTVDISVEDFYAYAADADVLIYNASIEDQPGSLEELTSQVPILSRYRAVQDGHVWTSTRSLYQNGNAVGTITEDFYKILTGQGQPVFFEKLEEGA